VKNSRDYNLKVRLGGFQRFYLILDDLNLPSGFFARVAEAVDLRKA